MCYSQTTYIILQCILNQIILLYKKEPNMEEESNVYLFFNYSLLYRENNSISIREETHIHLFRGWTAKGGGGKTP